MERFNDSVFKTFRPNVSTTLFGEVCLVAVSTQVSPGNFIGEVYLLIDRPRHVRRLRMNVSQADFGEAIQLDHDFVIEECKSQGDVILVDLIYEIAQELERPEFKSIYLSFFETNCSFVGYWMRDKFRDEIRIISEETLSAPLALRLRVAMGVNATFRWESL